MAAIVFLLSPLSAFASTTESMLMYAAVEDEYAVMPLTVVSSFPVSFYVGNYNLYSDSFNWTSRDLGNLSNGSLISGSDYFNFGHSFNFSLGDMPAFGVSFGTASNSSSLSVPDGSTFNFYVNDFYLSSRLNDSSGTQYLLYSSSMVPYRVYADMYFTATQQIGNTHSGTYHNQTVDVTSFIVPSQNPFDNGGFYLDLSGSIPIEADKTLGEGIDRIYNVNLRYIKLYVVFDYSQFLGLNNQSSIYSRQISVGYLVRTYYNFRNVGADSVYSSRISLSYDNFGNSSGSSNALQGSISNLGSSINKSISSLSNNVTNQFNQVKTQLTQSTNTITTKIDTMSNDIKTGLNNVISSAKENTQNIINTVTQKVDEVKTGISEVKDSILDLPNKLQEMLLGLIVPDSDTMASKYEEFSGLLEEKLGVIYQIPTMLFDFFDTIVNAATTPQTSLTLPAFQLPWIDGGTLTIWQPIEYDIMPDGLEVLSDLIQVVTSMTCIVLTFDTVRRFYRNFFGGGGPSI